MAHVQADSSGKAKGHRGRPIPALSLPVHQEGLHPAFPMKSILSIIPVLLATATVVCSQIEVSSVSRTPATALAVSTSARIIGEIPDGTPPLPEPPKPGFTVAKRDVIEAQTYQEGGRTITFQRIAPPPLVDVPEALPTAETVQEVTREELRDEQVVEVSDEYAADEFVMAGATVFRPKDGPPRSLVQLWPQGSGQSIAFWSSADFGLLSAIGSFVGNDGKTRSLMLIERVGNGKPRQSRSRIRP